MDQSSLFARRYSCRAYTAEPVSRQTITELLHTAILAPSAGNLQPWRFLLVTADKRKQALAAAALRQTFIVQASAIVAVCALPDQSGRVYGHRGRELYCLQDTAAAVENLLLAATERGLGTCWVGAFDEEAVARVLGVPPEWRPVALVPIGHPADAPTSRRRMDLTEVVLWLDP